MKALVNCGPTINVTEALDEDDNVVFAQTSNGWKLRLGDIYDVFDYISWWPKRDTHIKFESRKEKRRYIDHINNAIEALEIKLKLLKDVRDLFKSTNRTMIWLNDEQKR